MSKAPATVSELESHLGYWLRRVSNHVSGAFIQSLQTRQVSAAEWVALRLLYQHERLTPGQLAEAVGLTRGAISKVLDKLEAKRWITRAADREDSRVQWLGLTRAGARLVPELAELADRNDETFFGCLTRSERAVLKRLLGKLTEAHRLRGSPIN